MEPLSKTAAALPRLPMPRLACSAKTETQPTQSKKHVPQISPRRIPFSFAYKEAKKLPTQTAMQPAPVVSTDSELFGRDPVFAVISAISAKKAALTSAVTPMDNRTALICFIKKPRNSRMTVLDTIHSMSCEAPLCDDLVIRCLLCTVRQNRDHFP